MSESIEELHNKIMYLEERLNQLTQQEAEKAKRAKTKKESNIFEPCECPTCHKIYANKYILKTHMNKKHCEGERTRFICEHCHKSFCSPYYLKSHVEKLHPVENQVQNVELTLESSKA